MPKVHGAGTIEKRKDRQGKTYYRVRFNLGIDPKTKERRFSPWRGPYSSKEKAIVAAAEYRSEIESGLRLDADQITFRKYADMYCTQRRQQGTLAPNTLRKGEYLAKSLCKYLGDIKLREIDTLTIQAALAELGEDGKSPGAVAESYRMLKQIISMALSQDLITRNPCNKIKTPKAKRPQISFLNNKEISRFVKAIEKEEARADILEKTHRSTLPRKDHRFATNKVRAMFLRSCTAATRLILATGVRRGEGLGIIWEHIDFESMTLRITQQMTIDGIRSPKTDQAKRTISISIDTAERLKILKNQQAEFLFGFGIKQGQDTPVFINERGEFIDPSNFSRWWRAFCKANGFTGLKLHNLRHTQATLLIANGVDIKTVQARLGHATAAITLDLYSGVIPSKDREAADLIGSIIYAKPAQENKVVNL